MNFYTLEILEQIKDIPYALMRSIVKLWGPESAYSMCVLSLKLYCYYLIIISFKCTKGFTFSVTTITLNIGPELRNKKAMNSHAST